jgi:hypothetical protein
VERQARKDNRYGQTKFMEKGVGKIININESTSPTKHILKGKQEVG